eukprot:tig00000449_g933.t1
MCSFGSPSTRRTEDGLVKALCRELFVGCAIRKSVGNVIVQVARFALRVRLHFHQLRQSRRAGCTPAGYAGRRREQIPYTSGSHSGCRCGPRLRTGRAGAKVGKDFRRVEARASAQAPVRPGQGRRGRLVGPVSGGFSFPQLAAEARFQPIPRLQEGRPGVFVPQCSGSGGSASSSARRAASSGERECHCTRSSPSCLACSSIRHRPWRESTLRLARPERVEVWPSHSAAGTSSCSIVDTAPGARRPAGRAGGSRACVIVVPVPPALPGYDIVAALRKGRLPDFVLTVSIAAAVGAVGDRVRFFRDRDPVFETAFRRNKAARLGVRRTEAADVGRYRRIVNGRQVVVADEIVRSVNVFLSSAWQLRHG